MEDFKLDILIGKGPTARSIRLDLPRFTLVGATTRTGLVTGPLRDRFGFVGRLDLYGVDDLQAIVLRSAQILGVPVDPDGAREIAERSRGTPRIANRLLRRVRDFVEVRAAGKDQPPASLATAGLELFGVDKRTLGWTRLDQLHPRCAVPPVRRPAGRAARPRWPSASARSPNTIEDAYEPYLLQQWSSAVQAHGPGAGWPASAAWAHLGRSEPPADPTLL